MWAFNLAFGPGEGGGQSPAPHRTTIDHILLLWTRAMPATSRSVETTPFSKLSKSKSCAHFWRIAEVADGRTDNHKRTKAQTSIVVQLPYRITEAFERHDPQDRDGTAQLDYAGILANYVVDCHFIAIMVSSPVQFASGTMRSDFEE
ncbi:hypothetical protein ACSW29_23820 [Rhodococcus sp. GB-02]